MVCRMKITGNIVLDLGAALDAEGHDGASALRADGDEAKLWVGALALGHKDLALAFELWRRGQDIDKRAFRCPPRSAERVEGIQRSGALYAAALAVLAEMP